MARLNVNPTRMERSHQKEREKTARRGHKLLKDKSDEMLRQFMRMVKQNKSLREQVESEVSKALRLFMLARIQMTSQEIENALESCATDTSILARTFSAEHQNIMGLVVPKIVLSTHSNITHTSIAPLLTTSPSFDQAIQHMSSLMQRLIELANIEKACTMLAADIERNRRRINALEYSVIPQISETVRYITMKLAENERGNQVRLMKVKEMLEEELVSKKANED